MRPLRVSGVQGQGDMAERHLADLAFSEGQKRFGFSKRDSLPRFCRDCPHVSLCWGECPKNRIVRAPDGEAGLNYLCPGLKRFWSHTETQHRAVAEKTLRGERIMGTDPVVQELSLFRCNTSGPRCPTLRKLMQTHS